MDKLCVDRCLKYSIFVFVSYIVCYFVYAWMDVQLWESEPKIIHMKELKNLDSEKRTTCEKRLPNCLIIGIQKGGTRALLTFLSQHPQIVTHSNKTEYHFFSFYYRRGLNWYRENMPCSLPGQIVIEKSPTYFVTPEVPRRVFNMDSNIKLLLIVRNPIQRTISAYYMFKRLKKVPVKKQGHITLRRINTAYPSFESSWDNYIQEYDSYFENWLKYFELKQIHVVDGEVLLKSPVKELNKVEDFLQIHTYFDDSMFVLNSTKGFYCLRKSQDETNESECLSSEKGHQHPNVPASVLRKMKDFFRPQNKRFFNLSGRYFDWDD